MKKLLILIGAALGGLAFWRRKELKRDAEKAADVAKTATERAADVAKDATSTASARLSAVRSGRAHLMKELGEEVYASRVDPSGEHDAAIERIIGEIQELDSTDGPGATDGPAVTESATTAD